MKKNLHYFICSILLLMCHFNAVFAQTVANYSFTQSTGTYTALAAPTTISFGATTTTWDDNEQPVLFSSVTPAFAFSFNGVAMTNVRVNSNGYVTFGSTASSTTGYTPISASTAYTGAIAAFARDLTNNSQPITWGVEGTSPNRVFVIQWNQARRYSSGIITGDNLNFQIRLTETTNVIQIRYGSCVATSTTGYSGQVGLRGATNTDYNDRSGTAAWTATTLGTSNAATVNATSTLMPASGLTFTYSPPVPCTGTPAPGNTVASITTGCPGFVANLSLQNATTGTGVTYQWQTSSDNVTFTNVASAGTTATYTTPATSAVTYYRCNVTCSGVTTASTSVTLTPTPLTYFTPSTLPYVESFESWSNFCTTTADVPGTSWNNTPATGNNSWRRSDNGATWSSVSGAYTPTFTVGANSARLHTYSTSLIGNLDFYVNASAFTNVGLTFDYINTSGTDNLQIAYSTNGGTSFTNIGTAIILSATWTNFARIIPAANAATLIIRFSGQGDSGLTDIGIDNVKIDNVCSGTPVGGTTVASVSPACTGSTSVLSLSGNTSSPGIAYQWHSSPDNVTYTAITGATTSTYTVTITASLYYKCVLTCNAGTPASSTPVQVNLLAAPAYVSLATLPYKESFENWTNRCSTTDVPGSNWLNTPSTGNNSWRRDDQQASANWTSPTFYGYTPVFSLDAHSARFHSGYSSLGLKGILDLYVDATNYATLGLNFDYINASGTDVLNVLLSTNGGSTFTTIGAASAVSATWLNVFKNLPTANSATCVIRFEATSDYGTTDIGIDNLILDNLCSGTPTAGTVATTNSTPCSGANFTLSLTGTTNASGLTYQWQNSVGGAAFANIASATASTLTTNISTNTTYQCVVTCPNPTASSATSNTRVENIYAPSTYQTIGTLPFSAESFETWTNLCGTSDVPSAYWLSVPVTGNNAWRRDDEGSTATWGSLTSYGYTPVFSVGTHSARFHSGNASAGLIGSMDYYFNASAYANVGMSFDHINTSGSDVLDVQLSTNGGTTFTSIQTFGLSASWLEKGVVLPTANAANCILRFKATADFGSTDIGIDNLKFVETCTGTPTAGTIATSCGTVICSGQAASITQTGQTTGVGIKYQWQSSTNGGSTWADVAAATSVNYAPVITAAISYRCIVYCNTIANQSISNQLDFTLAPAAQCYCTTSLGGFTNPAITNVTFNTLNYTSGAAPLVNSNYYENVCSATTTVSPGATYNVSVTTDAAAIVSVWIDYNANGTFEASEWVQPYIAAMSGSASITIPTTAVSGVTGMRVRTRGSGNSNAATDACTNFFSGETEDYKITIGIPCFASSGTTFATGDNSYFMNTQCEEPSNAYTYYGYGPTYGFAIKWGANSANTKINANVVISHTTNPGIISGAGNATFIHKRIWNVIPDPANPLTAPVDVRFYYNPADTTEIRAAATAYAAASGTAVTNMKWFKSKIGSFDPSSPSFNSGIGTIPLSSVIELTPVYGADPNLVTYVQFNGVTSFSGGTSAIAAGLVSSPLPIHFVGFDAQEVGQNNMITWSAIENDRSDYYVVESSIDAKHWVAMSQIKASNKGRYEVLDTKPSCFMYYRIHGFEKDGQDNYTSIKNVIRRCNKFNISNLAPNPTSDAVRIVFETVEKIDVQLNIIDINGRVLKTQLFESNEGINTQSISIEDLPQGTYLLQLKQGQDAIIQRFVKQ